MEAKSKEHHNMRSSFDESFPAIRRARESLLRRLHTSDPPPECQSKTDENSEHQERQGLTSWEDGPVPTIKNVVQLEKRVTEKKMGVSTIASHAVATNALRNAGDQDSISAATECQTECQIEHDAYEQEYATYTSLPTEYVSLRAPPAQLVWKEVEEYGARILQPNSLSQTAQHAFLADKHNTQG